MRNDDGDYSDALTSLPVATTRELLGRHLRLLKLVLRYASAGAHSRQTRDSLSELRPIVENLLSSLGVRDRAHVRVDIENARLCARCLHSKLSQMWGATALPASQELRGLLQAVRSAARELLRLDFTAAAVRARLRKCRKKDAGNFAVALLLEILASLDGYLDYQRIDFEVEAVRFWQRLAALIAARCPLWCSPSMRRWCFAGAMCPISF